MGTLIFIAAAPMLSHAVVINELLAWNWYNRADENGDWEDWIELYNPSAFSVNLSGYSLTDDPTAPRKWVFPSVSIPANGFLFVWASSKNRTQVGFPLHTNFRLERNEEFLGLYDGSGAVVDSVSFGQQYQDASYGRKPDGGATWLLFTTPTPGAPNSTVGAPGFAGDPVFSRPGGPASAPVSVSISSAMPGSQIRYALGGNLPTEASTLYTDPLWLTTPTVIRARAYAPPLWPSKVVTQTYLVNVGTSLPLLSLVTEPSNLWGPTGIYYANLSGMIGERPCSVEYWEERGAPGFTVACGLRMHGGASQQRTDIHKKSFRLHFRRDRGPTELEYPMFDSTPVDRFNQIVLRANYNDGWAHHTEMQRTNAIFVRDEMARALRLEMGDVASHGCFCLLFLNGRFWGIYNPCERVENAFLESYLDQPLWDLISLDNEVHEGTKAAWDSFVSWFSTNDLTLPSNYEQLQTMLDLKNYTDYMISNICMRNSDWPHHNGYVARARGVAGAKWIFLDWDSEYGFGGGPTGTDVDYDMMARATDVTWPITRLLSRLIQNPAYRIYFAQRMDVLLNSAHEKSHIIQRMNELAKLIRPAVPLEGTMPGLYRGPNSNLPPYTYTIATWEAALRTATTFISNRAYYSRLHAQNRFLEITGWMGVKVLPPVGGQGDVKLHSILPPKYPWSGTFFRGIPLTLHAIPQPGYIFHSWSDPALPSTASVSVVLTAAHGSTYTIYARFATDMSPPTIASLEFVARNRLAVRFSKPVERTSAETLSNYSLDHGVGFPTSATLQTSPTIVLLEFANPLSGGTNYQLSVTNVRSQVGSPIPQGSPATATASFVVPIVTITEIMYNSIGPDVEWIELHNTTSAAVDVSGWYLTDDDTHPAQGEGSWTLPPSTLIPPQGYILVGIDNDLSGWNFPTNIPIVMPIVGQNGNLDNRGDNLALYTAASGGMLIDGSLTVAYPDLSVAGRSLEKADDDFQWSGNPLAWRQCTVPIYWATALGTHASPGRRNGSPASLTAAKHWTLY